MGLDLSFFKSGVRFLTGLRSSRAHSDRTPANEVQECPLRAEIGEEIGEELVRRKWTWKWR